MVKKKYLFVKNSVSYLDLSLRQFIVNFRQNTFFDPLTIPLGLDWSLNYFLYKIGPLTLKTCQVGPFYLISDKKVQKSVAN